MLESPEFQKKGRAWLPAAALLCAAAGFVLRLLHACQFQNALVADEAIIGLMARHIATGQAWPVFYYGQAYLGAMEAYLGAALGASPLAFKLVPALFSTALIGVTYAWAREAFGREEACIAAVLVAVPPLYVFDFGLRGGGFIQAIVLLLVVTLLARRVGQGASDRAVGLLGLVCGLLVWTYQTFAVHLLALGVAQCRAEGLPGRRRAFIWGAGFGVGCAPLLIYNIVHPLATALDLGVKYTGVTGTLYKTHGAPGAVLQGLMKRASEVASIPAQLAILYTSDPDVEVPDLTVASLTVMGIHAIAVVGGLVSWRRRPNPAGLSGEAVALLMASMTLVTGFFRPRYLMACVVFIAALTGRGLAHRWVRPPLLAAALTVIVCYNTCQIWKNFETGDTAPHGELIAALRENGLRYGYTGYDIAYPVAFLSGETILLSPKAGPLFFDRLPRYTEQVRAQTRVCYVFEDGSEIDARFRALLAGLGASCERLRAGRFAIYHGLSPDAVRAIPLPVGVVAER